MNTGTHITGQQHAEAAWLTLRQGAQRGQTSIATLRREIRCGHLQHVRVGGRRAIRLRPEWLDAWLEAGGTEPEPVVTSRRDNEGRR